MSGHKTLGARALFCAGVVCLVVAAAMALMNAWEERHLSEVRSEALGALSHPRVELDAATLDPMTAMPTLDVGGMAFVGVLEIPEIGLSCPVLSAGSEENGVAPIVYEGSPYAGRLVIVGGGDRDVLGRLGEMAGDEDVVVRDTLGNEFVYMADGVETLRPTSVARALGEDGAEGLILCELDSSGRVVTVVRCVVA